MPVTGTGTSEEVVVPLPNSPLVFGPQHSAVPLLKTAHALKLLADTPVAVVMPFTVTGTDELVVELSPVRFDPVKVTMIVVPWATEPRATLVKIDVPDGTVSLPP